jgi:hypothetical protein
MPGMGTQPGKASAVWPLRFSLRSILVLTTLGCIYFGGWAITKEWVVDDLLREPGLRCVSPVPYLAVVDELDAPNFRYLQRGYFCCLGLKVPLPYAWECSDRSPLILGGVIPRIIIQKEDEVRLGISAP